MKTLIRPSLSLSLALAVAAPVFLNSCGQKAQQEALVAQQEADALKSANAKLEAEVKRLKAETEKGNNDLLERNQELQKEADEAKAQFEKLQDEAVKARKELEEYMAKYKVSQREKLKGTQIPSIQTTEGKSYHQVVVREVTPSELSIAHSTGMARLALQQLPADMQTQFLYDPEEEKKAEEAKAAAEAELADLEKIEGVTDKITRKNAQHTPNPIAVRNLKQRIITREYEIRRAVAEASRVKNQGDDRTNLGQLRLQVLKQRAARLRGEITALAAMLEKELNG